MLPFACPFLMQARVLSSPKLYIRRPHLQMQDTLSADAVMICSAAKHAVDNLSLTKGSGLVQNLE